MASALANIYFLSILRAPQLSSSLIPNNSTKDSSTASTYALLDLLSQSRLILFIDQTVAIVNWRWRCEIGDYT
ncbi:uncharacterized protein BDV17DRAFT_260851 [Aspergillus undulatus]|uniref:uncharacterized protein n=1 Tax=Aspergillus undulatus TaxID=1810928 RepID=UPI003CCE1F30